MSQLTIYLEDKLEQKVRSRAQAEGVSVSKWIALTIEANERDCWPPNVLASLGTWSDVPDLKSIRAAYGKNSKRETFD